MSIKYSSSISASSDELNVKNASLKTDSLQRNSSNSTSKYETIIIGDAYCGKTTYLNSLASFEAKSDNFVSISDDRSEYEFKIIDKNKRATFIVRDTANQERFRSLTQSYYRKAQCVFLVFDLNDTESFFNLSKWYNDSLNYCKYQDDNFGMVLVGIKKKNPNQYKDDLTVVDPKIIREFKQEKQLIVGYSEVDLVNEINLRQPFEILLNHLCDRAEERQNKNNSLRRSSFVDKYQMNRKLSTSSIDSNVDKTIKKTAKLKLKDAELSEDPDKRKCCVLL